MSRESDGTSGCRLELHELIIDVIRELDTLINVEVYLLHCSIHIHYTYAYHAVLSNNIFSTYLYLSNPLTNSVNIISYSDNCPVL